MAKLAFQFVEVKRYGEVAAVVINDPPANTLTYDLMLQLEDVFFELLLDSDTRAVVLSGAGEKFFSGGVNIGMLRNVSPHYNSNFILYAAEVFDRINRSHLLVVAAINGHVTGGGLELALIADKRVAIEGTYNFGFPELRLGVIPGLGGTQRLARIAGPHRALELITHGDFLPVSRAKELGVVDTILPKENFLAAAIEYARELLREVPAEKRTSNPYRQWQRPSRPLASYNRRDRVGVITFADDCRGASSLQVLWALNQAILMARLDEGVEALMLTHDGDTLRLGAESPVCGPVWDYAQFVFGRLENFPRLCVLAFRGALNPLAAELALACDYRLTCDADVSHPKLFVVSGISSRIARYLRRDARPPADGISITLSQAVERGLVRLVEAQSWPESALKWTEPFVSPRGASKAIGYAKLAVVKGASLPDEACTLLERHLQEQLFRSHDGPEGMRAYLEKRPPKFKGE